MKSTIMIIILLFFSQLASAKDCFDLAGRDYRIDPDLLRAIAWTESRFNINAVGQNKDTSLDIGIMQINSQHTKELNQYGINQIHLKSDVCLNIYTGAYYLAIAFKKWGVNWNAVGAYNAGFRQTKTQAERRYLYAQKIHAYYMALKR